MADAKYYSIDQIKKNDMGGACGTYGRRAHKVLVGRPEGKRSHGRPRLRLEDNTEIRLQEMDGEALTGLM
jgi:hypothetical protein